MLVYGKCECFVMQIVYVCVVYVCGGSSQCCILHNLQFVNAGRGRSDHMEEAYSRGGIMIVLY